LYQVLLVDGDAPHVSQVERLPVWGGVSGFALTGAASDGESAITWLCMKKIDLVITAVDICGQSGFDLLKELKRNSFAGCVALMHERPSFEHARKAMVLGASDFLIKPVTAEHLLELFERQKPLLTECAAESSQIGQIDAEERNLLALIKAGNNPLAIPRLFELGAQNLTGISGAAPKGAAARRLFSRVRTALFARYGWLRLYEPEEFANSWDVSFLPELRKLCELIDRLRPACVPENIAEICEYILENPQGEISLSATAGRFYINHTYLSNIFRQKTGRRYNDYVTLVRMERARFLLAYSAKKVYEIGGLLGYRDAEYFKHLFKKQFGRTPGEYRKFASNEAMEELSWPRQNRD